MAKKVENKIAKISEKETLTYSELIMSCVKFPNIVEGQPQGYDYETLKKIQRVDNVIGIDKLTLDFTFEDADFDFVKSKVQSMSWGVYSTELIDFVTYIIELK
jgi:hypothetical protein